MKENILLIDIPNFVPQYRTDEIYSYEGKGKNNLKKVLIEASSGYCMYCYTKVLVDGKNFGELEHSVEKFNCNKLKNCPSNISIACPKCNGSFKKKGEKKRALTQEELIELEINSECGITCISSCEEYKKVRKSYINKEDGQIILQPFGVKNDETGREYLIQYDILNQKFIPSTLGAYSDDEKSFIAKHINRFNLNEPKYRTKEFSKFIEDVVEYNAIPKRERYCNLIVDLFIDSMKDIQKDKVIKLCKIIFTNLVAKSKM